MVRPSIIERIRALDSSKSYFPEYQDLLNLHKEILEILLPLEETRSKHVKKSLNEDQLESLREETLRSKKSIIYHLDPSMFEAETVLNATKKIVKCMMRFRPEDTAMVRLKEALEHRDIDFNEAVKAIMKGDVIWFQNISKKFTVEPSFLLFLFSTPLQPFFEDFAGRVGETFMEKWLEPVCPVCGRCSTVARMKDKKRYMVCTFCGAEYLVDLFLCTNCGNRDPNSLGFISFEEHPEYELNYCEKCQHYIKVLRENQKNRHIPPGLEDLLTQELDRFAKEELNLIRG